MSKENELYCKLQSGWIDENLIAMQSCQRSVDDYAKQADINRRMVELYKERIHASVDEFNDWATRNGVEQMCYPC